LVFKVDIEDKNVINALINKTRIPRDLYIKKYGPTVGDKIYLGDTNLILEIEKDFTVYGDELKLGVGQSLREGMAQAINVRNDSALDTILANVIIVDSVSGVIKADIGIRVISNEFCSCFFMIF
jgi:urease